MAYSYPASRMLRVVGLLLLFLTGGANALGPGTQTTCEFGNVVETFRISNNVNEFTYEVSVVVDTYSYCQTIVLPNAGSQIGGGGGSARGSLAQALSNLFDQDGDDLLDCWNQLTFDPHAPLSSGFGPRTHPVTGAPQSNHNGIDIAVPTGTSIRAAADGVIDQIYDGYAVGQGIGNGNFIRIDYDDGTQGVYLHLENVHVVRGDAVLLGEVIGTSNDTGTSSGPHLHYSLWKSSNHTGSASDLSNFHDPAQHHNNCGP